MGVSAAFSSRNIALTGFISSLPLRLPRLRTIRLRTLKVKVKVCLTTKAPTVVHRQLDTLEGRLQRCGLVDT